MRASSPLGPKTNWGELSVDHPVVTNQYWGVVNKKSSSHWKRDMPNVGTYPMPWNPWWYPLILFYWFLLQLSHNYPPLSCHYSPFIVPYNCLTIIPYYPAVVPQFVWNFPYIYIYLYLYLRHWVYFIRSICSLFFKWPLVHHWSTLTTLRACESYHSTKNPKLSLSMPSRTYAFFKRVFSCTMVSPR